MNQVRSLNSSIKNKVKKLAWQRYAPGDEISVSNSGVWQVDRGIVQLSRLKSDGNEVIVGFVTANGTFENSLSSSSVVYRATALSNVYLKYYSQQDIAESPMLARNLLGNFSDRLEKTQQLWGLSSNCTENHVKTILSAMYSFQLLKAFFFKYIFTYYKQRQCNRSHTKMNAKKPQLKRY